MIADGKEWNSKIKELKSIMLKSGSIESVKDLILDLHAYVHSSAVSHSPEATLEDRLFRKKSEGNFTVFSEKNLYSIAWHLWHSARIEDITCSYFLSGDEEIFCKSDYLNRLAIDINHTGNSMSFEEMKDFNARINLNQLAEYRDEAGKKTRKQIQELSVEKLKQKVSREALEKIRKSGSVDSRDNWLIDFWGRKKITGIVTMPLTRHLLVHLNSSVRLV